MSNFLERATYLTSLGYPVVPLEGKSPDILGEKWQLQATADLIQINHWAVNWPDANVGVVRQDEGDKPFHVIDIESWEWFAEATSHLPPLYAGLDKPRASIVITGNLGLHIYVAGRKPVWARTVPNPSYKSKEETPDIKPAFIEFPKMVVGPGSVHPETKREYRPMRSFGKPLPLPDEYIEWLKSLYAKDLSPKTLKCRPLRPGATLQSVLDGTELNGKYEVVETADRVYLNYHSRLGRCLIKGAAHSESRNNAHCGFFYMKADPSDWGHHCHAAKCQTVEGGQRKAALSGLGLELQDVIRPKCRDLARRKSELDQRPLQFVVDRFIPAEGVTGIGGPSGHGKTYMMLSLAKHISQGTKAFGFLECKQSPVLYLLAEGGDSALLKRLNELKIEDSEDFLARTISQGPILSLNNPGLVELAKGRVVFLDTFPRWLQGREENSSTQMAALFQLAMEMLTSGAIAVVLAQHATKGSKKAPFRMTADCVFRGSGDIVANLAAGHGIYQLDNQRRDRTLIHVECVKPRDFEPLRPFQLEGKPHINNTGDFECHKTPGACGWFDDEIKAYNAALKGTQPQLFDDRYASVLTKQTEGKSVKQIAAEMGVSERTIYNILKLGKEQEAEKTAADIADDPDTSSDPDEYEEEEGSGNNE